MDTIYLALLLIFCGFIIRIYYGTSSLDQLNKQNAVIFARPSFRVVDCEFINKKFLKTFVLTISSLAIKHNDSLNSQINCVTFEILQEMKKTIKHMPNCAILQNIINVDLKKVSKIINDQMDNKRTNNINGYKNNIKNYNDKIIEECLDAIHTYFKGQLIEYTKFTVLVHFLYWTILKKPYQEKKTGEKITLLTYSTIGCLSNFYFNGDSKTGTIQIYFYLECFIFHEHIKNQSLPLSQIIHNIYHNMICDMIEKEGSSHFEGKTIVNYILNKGTGLDLITDKNLKNIIRGKYEKLKTFAGTCRNTIIEFTDFLVGVKSHETFVNTCYKNLKQIQKEWGVEDIKTDNLIADSDLPQIKKECGVKDIESEKFIAGSEYQTKYDLIYIFRLG